MSESGEEQKDTPKKPSGRKKPEHEKYVNRRYTCPPELYARLEKYCEDEERTHSWAIQKALDQWLSEKGY